MPARKPVLAGLLRDWDGLVASWLPGTDGQTPLYPFGYGLRYRHR